MEMTPEKLAFIKGQTVKDSKVSAVESPAAKVTVEKTIELELSTPEDEASKEPRSKPGRRSTRGRSSQGKPEASELLDQVLVPVTIRLPRRIAQALRRACLEQQLRHAIPHTQQDIVDEALTQWLSTHEFLD